MRLFKTEAAVLRTRELGEADRLVTLLSRERGKINACLLYTSRCV